MDYILDGFKRHLRKQKESKKGIEIIPVNFGSFQAKIVNGGIFDLVSLMHLAEWAATTLQQSAHLLSFIYDYHKDSPKRVWDKLEIDDEDEYCVGLDLERFMESDYRKKQDKSIGYSIPDNYELAEKVLAEFRAVRGNKKWKLYDNSYRETAMWKSKDADALKALAEFIDNTYVQPEMEEVLKVNKIAKCIFTKKGIDFEYTK
jgi:hypothetical protein